MAATISLGAQEYQKNIFGVRAGLNITNASLVSGGLKYKYSPRAGLFLGGVYQRALTNNIPLYLETGLNISQFGYNEDFYGEGSVYKYDIWYLQVPVMVNYRFFVGDVTLYPSAGFVYSFGFAGQCKYVTTDDETGEKSVEKWKVFGKYNEETGDGGELKRSDLGMRIAVNAEWKQLYVGVAYGFGFLNLARTGEDDEWIAIGLASLPATKPMEETAMKKQALSVHGH